MNKNPFSPAVLSRYCEASLRLKSEGFWNPESKFEFEFLSAAQRFNSATLWKVFALGQLIEEEQPVTVRRAFYRGSSTGVFPDTSDCHYIACKRLILEMRRAHLIPYTYIADSTRRRLKPASWSGLADYAETVANCYRKNLWARQAQYIEVFVEKDAMAGVIQPVTDKFDVCLNVIRGNCSETFVYNVAEQWKAIQKPITAYYLGDHDPNGLQIEQDLRKRLKSFYGRDFGWSRLAVTKSDFDNPEVLGFPVKQKNKKRVYGKPYIKEFGDRCVEVDAISANVIRQRVRDAILSHIDQREWEFLQAQEEREKVGVFDLVRRMPTA